MNEKRYVYRIWINLPDGTTITRKVSTIAESEEKALEFINMCYMYDKIEKIEE